MLKTSLHDHSRISRIIVSLKFLCTSSCASSFQAEFITVTLPAETSFNRNCCNSAAMPSTRLVRVAARQTTALLGQLLGSAMPPLRMRDAA